MKKIASALLLTASCAFAQPSLKEIEKNAVRGQVYFENTYHYDCKRLESAPGFYFKTEKPLVVQIFKKGVIRGWLSGWVERSSSKRTQSMARPTVQIKGFELYQKGGSWFADSSTSIEELRRGKSSLHRIFSLSPAKTMFPPKPGSRVGIVAKLWINGTNALAFLGRAVVKRIP